VFLLFRRRLDITSAGVFLQQEGGFMRVPTLVLRTFNINTSGNGQPCLEISGRPSGIIAWLLTIMNLSAETHMVVTDRFFSIKGASLMGEFNNFVPLPHVSSTHCGFSKPIGYIIAGFAVAIFGVISGLNQRDGTPLIAGGLIVGLIFLVAYFFSRKLIIGIRTAGGLPFELMFKPGVLGSVRVDIDSVRQAITLLNDKVLQAAR
jgi:hypothetical protein